uniref:Uncharacterized protein n=1 Tax=uncultured marine virus TaxID=186617 RepID=A0A0F7L2Q3_9VIRU|nr:hypothetical protein [uncultured marine virus]
MSSSSFASIDAFSKRLRPSLSARARGSEGQVIVVVFLVLPRLDLHSFFVA